MKQSAHTLLLIFTTLISTSIFSAEKESQAQSALQLWVDACLYHAANYQDLTIWARANNLRRADADFSQRALEGEKGEVWQLSKKQNNLFLLLGASDTCAVWAAQANAKETNALFEQLMSSIEDPSPKLAVDKTVKGKDGEYRQIAYYLHPKDGPHGWIFIATTSDSDTAAIQARLTMGPAVE
jgi:hypothetical protein